MLIIQLQFQFLTFINVPKKCERKEQAFNRITQSVLFLHHMKAQSGAHLGFSEGRSPNLGKGAYQYKTKRNEHKYTNTYTIFQGEIVNPFLVGAPGSFNFLNKKHGFW